MPGCARSCSQPCTDLAASSPNTSPPHQHLPTASSFFPKIQSCQRPGKCPAGPRARLCAHPAAGSFGVLCIAGSYPRACRLPKIALCYSCGRLCVLGSSPGGSQRGLQASGGALVAGGRCHGGLGAPVPWAGLGALAAVSAEARFVPLPGCGVPVAMETEVRPAGEKCYSERQ